MMRTFMLSHTRVKSFGIKSIPEAMKDERVPAILISYNFDVRAPFYAVYFDIVGDLLFQQLAQHRLDAVMKPNDFETVICQLLEL